MKTKWRPNCLRTQKSVSMDSVRGIEKGAIHNTPSTYERSLKERGESYAVLKDATYSYALNISRGSSAVESYVTGFHLPRWLSFVTPFFLTSLNLQLLFFKCILNLYAITLHYTNVNYIKRGSWDEF